MRKTSDITAMPSVANIYLITIAPALSVLVPRIQRQLLRSLSAHISNMKNYRYLCDNLLVETVKTHATVAARIAVTFIFNEN